MIKNYNTFLPGIPSSVPNSVKVMLLYSLLADRMLCSITAESKIVEPEGGNEIAISWYTRILMCKAGHTLCNMLPGGSDWSNVLP